MARPQRSQKTTAPGQPPGLDLNALLPMLAHLYGIQQEQMLAPGKLQGQDLQNELARLQIAQAPATNAARIASDNATAKYAESRAGQVDLPHGFEFLDPETQQQILDVQVPGHKDARDQKNNIAKAQKWSGLVKDSRIQGQNPDNFGPLDAEWGPGMGQYLAGLKTSEAPSTSGPPAIPGVGGLLGRTARGVGNIPQHLQNLDSKMTDMGGNFWASLMGVDPNTVAPVKMTDPAHPAVLSPPNWFDKFLQFMQPNDYGYSAPTRR